MKLNNDDGDGPVTPRALIANTGVILLMVVSVIVLAVLYR